MAVLCKPCRSLSDDWLEYSPPQLIRITAGASHDDSARGCVERLATFRKERLQTVLKAQAHIRELCASGKHADSYSKKYGSSH